jgi:hypothetical protein
MILYRKYSDDDKISLSTDDLLEFAKKYNINIPDHSDDKKIIETLRIFEGRLFQFRNKSMENMFKIIEDLSIDISNIEGSGKNGKIVKSDLLRIIDRCLDNDLDIKGPNKEAQLIKIIDNFLHKSHRHKDGRKSVKIPNCCVYWLDSPSIVEKIGEETFRVGTQEIRYDPISDTWICSSHDSYKPRSDIWVVRGDDPFILQNTAYLYRYRKAFTFLEILVLYLKIKLVLSKNDIPQDVIFHTIRLYRKILDISDIKIL